MSMPPADGSSATARASPVTGERALANKKRQGIHFERKLRIDCRRERCTVAR
jgi:hypothetical protein